MRIAAVDYGRRRIGLAICDPLGITVRGLDTVVRGPDLQEAARQVAATLKEEGAERVLLGLPLHASGEESDMSREARAFGVHLAAALAPELTSPLDFVDETLTTWEAEEAIRARGIPLRRAKKEGLLDQAAARCLLQAWLREGGKQASEDDSPPDA
jgi:putative Holliday junction resolvase